MMDIARSTALNILIEYDKSGIFPNLSLKKHLRNIAEERDRAFTSALVYGVIEKRLLLDYYIGCVSSVKVKKINVAVINILRMGLYQLMFLSTPASAACNTSVELAKKNGQYKSAAFVNAILRKLSVGFGTIEPSPDMYVKYSVGKSVGDELVLSLGEDEFEQFMESGSDDRSVYIAVNTLKVTEDELISLLSLEGTAASKTEHSGLLRIPSAASIERSSAFKAGLYHVIGLPSYLCACAVAPSAGDTVIDMCAAPGGKTFAMAYLSGDNADITAFDLHEHKVENLLADGKRLGLHSVKAVKSDSSQQIERLIGTADKILCDVPCSGLGMIFNKPDIKYNDIDHDSLVDTQYKILCNAASYLKKGGRLVYSTCTVSDRENGGIVRRFINDNPDFSIDGSVNIFGDSFGEYTFLPHVDKTDGFYIAVLTKK